MRIYTILVATLFCLGVVDFIENGMANVEFRTDGAETYHADIPIELFPCEIREVRILSVAPYLYIFY
jgi:hypothetical protein